MNTNYKAVIFDLDGTLINTIEDLADATNSVLISHNLPTHDYAAYKYFVGLGLKKLVIDALPEEKRTDSFIAKVYDEMLIAYSKNCLAKTLPYAGITEMLDELRKTNLKLAVFSNKAHELTVIIVEALFGKWNFDFILGAKSDLNPKPSPDGAFQISKELNVTPEETLYLGDTGIDMNTANAANMFAIGALWGFRTREELEENGAKSLIDHPMDLIKLI